MKKTLLPFLLLLFYSSYSQVSKTDTTSGQSYFQAAYFYGNILSHQPSVTPSITDHPEGFILSWNKKNFGKKSWEQSFNYPDVGLSFAYQNYKNEIIGELYSLYAHYNFYFFNRLNKNQLILRTGIGLAYNTTPYDKETNNKNVSFGTHLNSSTYFKLYFQRERLFKNFGVNAGLTFIHASNSNFKSPNKGVNTWGVSVGLNYNLESEDEDFQTHKIDKKFTQPVKYNLVFRFGANESELRGSGVKPFYVFSGYADKRLTRKSTIQLGTEFFVSPFLKGYIEYYNINFPNEPVASSSDIYRIGIFVGHELFINKISVIVQLGYYAYYPFPYDTRYYERLGLKRYFGEKNKWFASVSLKAHAANAETVEFGFGIRL